MKRCDRAAAPVLVILAIAIGPVWLAARQGGGQFPGGSNPDGSLPPSAPVTRLFTQDASHMTAARSSR